MAVGKSKSPSIEWVLQKLRDAYGDRPWVGHGKGVDVLVETILSQNTSNANSQAGYRQLRREYPTWDAVADAAEERVERWIRVSGLSKIKAPRIQQILRKIREDRGRISLEFLRKGSVDDAAAYLREFKGIGPKTVGCVLLFAFKMPLFPVDTHIHRIAKRLGWIGEKVSAEKAHTELEPRIPPDDRYPLHVLLITHGRKICKAGRPLCEDCSLATHCPTGRKKLSES